MIITLYPNFNSGEDVERKKRFAMIWIKQIQRGDYERTKDKLENYLAESVFPPKLADFLVLPRPENKVNSEVELVKQWEEEVRKEREDPEMEKRRQETFERMRQKFDEIFGEGDRLD